MRILKIFEFLPSKDRKLDDASITFPQMSGQFSEEWLYFFFLFQRSTSIFSFTTVLIKLFVVNNVSRPLEQSLSQKFNFQTFSDPPLQMLLRLVTTTSMRLLLLVIVTTRVSTADDVQFDNALTGTNERLALGNSTGET